MSGSKIKIPKAVVQKYLNAKEGKGVRILEYKRLGSGWHGSGYVVKFKIQKSKGKSQVREVVLRTLMPENFSHDFISDRAKVFILQNEMSKAIPGHIGSFDVSGYSKNGDLVSLGDVKEYFQIVEFAHGDTYSKDFQRIKETGSISDMDRQRARSLAIYLASLHSRKLKATKGSIRSIRRRHTRDAIGHGEMMIGVVDTYPDGFTYTTKAKLARFMARALEFREKVKDTPFKPCRIHGDFHPANIVFNGSRVTVLDASRELWGDPADDVIALAMNYIWFAVMQTGKFSGPFSELFWIFWNTYFKKTRDINIMKTAGVHMAFRGVVVAHPFFYSAQSDDVRRKMLRLVEKVLGKSRFDPKKIDRYLRK